MLIVLVLIQQGKGADVGATFGGGSNSLFGAAGATDFLTKLTTGAVVAFMVTSLLLVRGYGKITAESRVVDPLEGSVMQTDAPAEVDEVVPLVSDLEEEAPVEMEIDPAAAAVEAEGVAVESEAVEELVAQPAAEEVAPSDEGVKPAGDSKSE